MILTNNAYLFSQENFSLVYFDFLRRGEKQNFGKGEKQDFTPSTILSLSKFVMTINEREHFSVMKETLFHVSGY